MKKSNKIFTRSLTWIIVLCSFFNISAKDDCSADIKCKEEGAGLLCYGKDFYKKVKSNIGLKISLRQGVRLDSKNITLDKQGRVIIDDPDFAKSVEIEIEKMKASQNDEKWFDNKKCPETNESQCKCINVECKCGM